MVDMMNSNSGILNFKTKKSIQHWIPKWVAFSIYVFLSTYQVKAQDFYLGVDLSYVNELEDCGTTYFSLEGVESDPYELLANKGANIVRLRLWHNPQWTEYSNFQDVKNAMERAKEQGMEVMLDLHYSDIWADPSRQWRPEAWNGIDDISILGDSVYEYTYNTIQRLLNEGLSPSIVQIGNEINGTILIERTTEKIDDSSPGLYPIDWSRQVSLLHRGIDAIKKLNADNGLEIKSLIHVAQPENTDWWFSQASINGLRGYDIIGISYYPQWSDYGVREVGEQVAFLTEEYAKEVMIVETAFPWTTGSNDGANNILGSASALETFGNEISQEIQRDIMTELAYLVKENGGSGVVYWEPAWVSSDCSTYWATGSHFENATLFDFDNKLNLGADFLSYDYSLEPEGLSDKEVSFSVNMDGINMSQGIYVTGDFSGESWQFMPMESSGENTYTYLASIPGRSEGAYIFYTNNEWDNQYRENVPTACADYWDTHRKYLIQAEAEQYFYGWGSCTTISVDAELENIGEAVRYIPGQKLLIIDTATPVQKLSLTNILGQNMHINMSSENVISLDEMTTGIYVLTVWSDSKISYFKFNKR
jgi:arabinogalactan endo-1,4-beta-galactosidase